MTEEELKEALGEEAYHRYCTLVANGQVLETNDEKAQLSSGVTHILLIKEGESPRLIRRRMC